ncbi:MAG TPA: hypothetical protein VKD47_00635 [Miltoncostaeaceae bacterium]|nr:hypothetical protein [Miltoncostaeaceae bacterium]
MRRRSQAGQASVELVGAIPILVLAVLVVLQLAAIVRGALTAQERARAAVVSGDGRAPAPVEVRSVLPGVGGLRVPVQPPARP